MIAIVHCGDLKYCPYMKRYIERLEQLKIDYKVYFWNRANENLQLTEKYVSFNSFSNLSKSKVFKFWDFFKFRSWLIKRMKSDKPEKIIVLSTMTGIVLSSFLLKNSIEYIFDIRDYSYEHVKFFYRIEKKVIEKSRFTTISSKGFKQFLPEHRYVIAHNFNRNDVVENAKFTKQSGKLSFVWNGVVRYFEFQKQYLMALKNDARFEIIYYGDGPELNLYKKFCQEENIQNVIFAGAYNNKDKYQLLKNASILNNCYGFVENSWKQNKVKYAVSNRFYDGAVYHIPQIVEPTGFKKEWTRNTQIGESFLPNDNFADKVYNWYMSINPEVFDRHCDEVLQDVMQEDDEFISMIDSFIKEKV